MRIKSLQDGSVNSFEFTQLARNKEIKTHHRLMKVIMLGLGCRLVFDSRLPIIMSFRASAANFHNLTKLITSQYAIYFIGHNIGKDILLKIECYQMHSNSIMTCSHCLYDPRMRTRARILSMQLVFPPLNIFRYLNLIFKNKVI